MSSELLTTFVLLASKESQHLIEDIALQAAYAKHIRPYMEFPTIYQQWISYIPAKCMSLSSSSGKCLKICLRIMVRKLAPTLLVQNFLGLFLHLQN